LKKRGERGEYDSSGNWDDDGERKKKKKKEKKEKIVHIIIPYFSQLCFFIMIYQL